MPVADNLCCRDGKAGLRRHRRVHASFVCSRSMERFYDNQILLALTGGW